MERMTHDSPYSLTVLKENFFDRVTKGEKCSEETALAAISESVKRAVSIVNDSGWRNVVRHVDGFVEFMSAFSDDELRPVKTRRKTLAAIGEATLRGELSRHDTDPNGLVQYHLRILRDEGLRFDDIAAWLQGAQKVIPAAHPVS